MATMRVALSKRERLVWVVLNDVDEAKRLAASRRLREQRWDHELRPDVGYSPSMRQRCEALADAAMLEHAAKHPGGRYLLPEEAVEAVMGT